MFTANEKAYLMTEMIIVYPQPGMVTNRDSNARLIGLKNQALITMKHSRLKQLNKS